jgi:hypothetical protein
MKQEVWVLMAAISTPAWCAAFAPPVGGGLLRTVPPQHGPQPGGARRGLKTVNAEIRAECLMLAQAKQLSFRGIKVCHQLHPDVSKDSETRLLLPGAQKTCVALGPLGEAARA